MNTTLDRFGVRLFIVAAALATGAPALGQAVLDVYGETLTSYKSASTATTEQDLIPRQDQRGVNIDGTGRAGPSFAWALSANPLEGGLGGQRMGDQRLDLGSYAPTAVDLALLAPGYGRWVIARSVAPLAGGAD